MKTTTTNLAAFGFARVIEVTPMLRAFFELKLASLARLLGAACFGAGRDFDRVGFWLHDLALRRVRAIIARTR